MQGAPSRTQAAPPGVLEMLEEHVAKGTRAASWKGAQLVQLAMSTIVDDAVFNITQAPPHPPHTWYTCPTRHSWSPLVVLRALRF